MADSKATLALLTGLQGQVATIADRLEQEVKARQTNHDDVTRLCERVNALIDKVEPFQETQDRVTKVESHVAVLWWGVGILGVAVVTNLAERIMRLI